MPFPSKLTDEQRNEIVERHVLGETLVKLAKEFKVSPATVYRVTKKSKKYKSKGGGQPVTSVAEFAKRAKSILWRQESGNEKDRKTFLSWKGSVAKLQENGMTKQQAIVQASKDFMCLRQLFSESDVSANDPRPDSHPTIRHFGQQSSDGDIKNEGKDQSHRENLIWAIEAAGKCLRIGERPASCPNDAAFYLFRQACDEPKDFLGKFNQVEIKGGDDEAQHHARKSGQRAIGEIEEMLAELDTWVDGAPPEREES